MSCIPLRKVSSRSWPGALAADRPGRECAFKQTGNNACCVLWGMEILWRSRTADNRIRTSFVYSTTKIPSNKADRNGRTIIKPGRREERSVQRSEIGDQRFDSFKVLSCEGGIQRSE